ncbi:MAG: TetR family transcriptional regulator [Candidatus Aminicenantes bacterium]|nr:MAG: TetR family transcriptional regulator [Candidatus Aminicenantes bacterium]
MKKTKEEAAFTRKLILDSALKVFSQKGYSAARLEDVAKHAGLTRGAIYWHFKNKHDLYCTLYKELSARAVKRIDEILKSEKTPLSKIRQLMREGFVYLEEDEEYRAFEEITLFKMEPPEKFKKMFEIRSRFFLFIKESLANLIREGITAGEIDAVIDPDITALAMMSYISGVKNIWLKNTTAFSPKKYAENLIQVFFTGITKK